MSPVLLALSWPLLPPPGQLQPAIIAPRTPLLLTKVPRFEPRERGSSPAASGETHAPLAAFSVPFLVTFGVAFRPFWTVTGTVAGGHGLRGDGSQQVVPLAQEFSLARESEAALPESHPRGVLGRPGAMGVLQLGQMGRVAFRDELRDKRHQKLLIWGLRVKELLFQMTYLQVGFPSFSLPCLSLSLSPKSCLSLHFLFPYLMNTILFSL